MSSSKAVAPVRGERRRSTPSQRARAGRVPSCPSLGGGDDAGAVRGDGGGRHPASVSAQGRDLLPCRVPHPRHVVVGGGSSGAAAPRARAGDPRDGARPRASRYGDEPRQSRQPLDRRSLDPVRFTHVRRKSARTRQRTSRTSEPRRGPTWARTGDPIQLSRVLNLLQEPNVMFGQAVRSSALPQQCEVPERWVAVVFIALGNVGHGLQRRAADVLGIQP